MIGVNRKGDRFILKGKKGIFYFFKITEGVKEDLAFFNKAGKVIRSAP